MSMAPLGVDLSMMATDIIVPPHVNPSKLRPVGYQLPATRLQSDIHRPLLLPTILTHNKVCQVFHSLLLNVNSPSNKSSSITPFPAPLEHQE
jgi:hypothetical protein